MIVKEVIDELNKLPPNAQVYLHTDYDVGCVRLICVDTDSDDDELFVVLCSEDRP